MIERHIDYLQFSALLSEQDILAQEVEPLPAPRFYKRGYRDVSGFRYYFGNPNSKKALIVASGETLHNVRASGKTDEFVLNWALAGDGVVTRLDLAVTEWVEDTLFLVEDVENWAIKGEVESVLLSGGVKTISEVFPTGSKEVQTLYIGSMKKRGKTGIFRAYDKGVELDLGAYLSTRIEVELRGENAHNTARRISQTGDIAGNFRAKFNVRNETFDRLMDSPVADISRGKAKETESEDEKMAKRWNWLIETVAPSLKEAREFDKKRWNSDDRIYWFLRDAGFSHDKIVALLDLTGEKDDNELRRSLRNDQ